LLRILIGHLDFDLPAHDTGRYDVRVVRFGDDGQTPARSIREMLATFPDSWLPDVYYHAGLVHFPVPTDLLDFPGLTVTHIQDWHRGGRSVWAGHGLFDLVVTERNACALLQNWGYERAVFARYWGVDPCIHRMERAADDPGRDIDVLFIGSLNPAVWSERNRWIDRIARLSDRYRVLVTAGHYGNDYTALTNRAKIVFNRSVNGCTNQRAYDGLACGALVFNETENEEVREAFDENFHCVYYSDVDLEAKIDRWLDPANADRRCSVVEAGRQRVLDRHTEEIHTALLLDLIAEWAPSEHYRPASRLSSGERAYRQALQIYSCALPSSAAVALDLLSSAEAELDRAQAAEARAALLGWVAHYAYGDQQIRIFTSAIDWARQAVRAEPRFAIAHLTLAFLLLERAELTGGAHPTGRNDISDAVVALSQAAERCEAALESTQEGMYGDIDGFGYPRWSDLYDSHIERAYLSRNIDEMAWANQMRATVAWRCRTMLAEMAAANDQGEEALRQARSAVLALPTEPESILALARHEALNGQLEMAIHHYRAGLAISPFACSAWAELTTVLKLADRPVEARAFVAERLKVIAAVPAFAYMRAALTEALEG